MQPGECLFCKIVRNEIPSKKVYEDGDTIAFLDIHPASPGHTLVVPKKHSTNIYDVAERDLEKAVVVAKKMAERMKNRFGVEGVNILQNNGRQAGQIVDHIHIHVIPRYAQDGVALHLPRANVTDADMNSIQAKLKEEERPKNTNVDFGSW